MKTIAFHDLKAAGSAAAAFRLLPWLLAAAALAGCNAGSQAAELKEAPSLRIVMRMHPDPQRLLEQLELRLGICRLEQRAKGVETAVPALPNAADIAKWVTRETEVIYAGNRRAEFSTDVMVWPNADKGCQWTFYKTVHAGTDKLCADSYGGSAKAEPRVGAALEAPSLDEDSTRDVQRCLTEATRKRKPMDLPKGTTPGGQPCLWLSESVVNGEPTKPGPHFCVHPRAYDGSLPQFRGGSTPTLRYLRVLPPGMKPGTAVEADSDRMEAEVVEDGQPIAPSRFSREAVEAYVRQPLVVPAQGRGPAGR